MSHLRHHDQARETEPVAQKEPGVCPSGLAMSSAANCEPVVAPAGPEGGDEAGAGGAETLLGGSRCRELVSALILSASWSLLLFPHPKPGIANHGTY